MKRVFLDELSEFSGLSKGHSTKSVTSLNLRFYSNHFFGAHHLGQSGETEAHLANYQPGVALVSFARNSVSHAICEKSSPAGSIAIWGGASPTSDTVYDECVAAVRVRTRSEGTSLLAARLVNSTWTSADSASSRCCAGSFSRRGTGGAVAADEEDDDDDDEETAVDVELSAAEPYA